MSVDLWDFEFALNSVKKNVHLFNIQIESGQKGNPKFWDNQIQAYLVNSAHLVLTQCKKDFVSNFEVLVCGGVLSDCIMLFCPPPYSMYYAK